MQSASCLHCACGLEHQDASRLSKVGWHDGGGGEFAMLVNCPCGATLTAARIIDGSQCDVCRRVVTGAEGDVKCCVVDEQTPLVLCAACFRRHPRRTEWLTWTVGEVATLLVRASA
jgi:hypothetical protein